MAASPSPRRIAYLVAIGCALALAIAWWAPKRGAARSAGAAGSSPGAAARGRSGGARGGSASAGARGGSDRSLRVQGTVLDARAARPIGGGEVVFRALGGGEITTRADANGRYEVFVAPGAYRAFVRGSGVTSVADFERERVPGPPRPSAVGAGRYDQAPLVVVRDDESGVDLHVEMAKTVTGRVTNRSGEPVAKAIVRARGVLRPVSGSDVAETAADGSFQLELPIGGYQIDASHPEYAGLEGSVARVEVEAERAPGPMALTLVAGCIVSGQVLNAEGAPAADGTVDFRVPGMPDFVPSAAVEADGKFRWTTIDEVDVDLRAWPWMSAPSSSESFHCKDGARLTTTLRVPASEADLDGTLETAGGEPAAGAFVDIIALTPGGMNQQERADAHGDWAVFALPAGEYLVTATVQGEGSVQRRVSVPSHDVELRLGGTGAIEGTIAGVRDGAVPVQVSDCSLDAPVYRYRSAGTRLVAVRDGRFKMEGIPACGITLHAQVAGQTAFVDVRVTRGGVASAHLDLTRRPEPPVVIETPPEFPATEDKPVDEPEPEPEPIAVAPEPDDAPEPPDGPSWIEPIDDGAVDGATDEGELVE